MPASLWPCADSCVTSFPATRTLPDPTPCNPVIASISSDCPLPSMPGQADDLAGADVNVTPRTFAIPRSSITSRSSTSSSGSDGCAGVLRDSQQHLATDHQAREALLGRTRRRERLDELARAGAR